MLKWIKPSKQTPRKGVNVLVFLNGSIAEASYDGKVWSTNNMTFHSSAVTYWAVLNKPKAVKPKRGAVTKGSSASLVNAGFEAFKSQVDGSVITDPSSLREHNKRNGVSDIRDYDEAHFAKRGKEMYDEKIGNTAQAKAERKEKIAYELARRGM